MRCWLFSVRLMGSLVDRARLTRRVHAVMHILAQTVLQRRGKHSLPIDCSLLVMLMNPHKA